MKLLGISFIVIFGIIFLISGAAKAQDTPEKINIQQLAWEIRKTTGVNCGGYNETNLTPQKCSLFYTENEGLSVALDPDIEDLRDEIVEVVDKHIASDNLPSDFPTKTPSTPVPTLKEKYQEALNDSERIDILAEAAGLK